MGRSSVIYVLGALSLPGWGHAGATGCGENGIQPPNPHPAMPIMPRLKGVAYSEHAIKSMTMLLVMMMRTRGGRGGKSDDDNDEVVVDEDNMDDVVVIVVVLMMMMMMMMTIKMIKITIMIIGT